MHDRPCFEVEFSDGSVIVADAEHLWTTTTRDASQRRGRRPAAVRTTAEIPRHAADRHRGPAAQPLGRTTAPLDLPDRDLPIAAVHARCLARRRAHPAARFTTRRPGDRRLRRGRRLRRTAAAVAAVYSIALAACRRAGRADVRRLRRGVPAPGDECAHAAVAVCGRRSASTAIPPRPAGLRRPAASSPRRPPTGRGACAGCHRLTGSFTGAAASGRRARRQAHPGGLPACVRGAAPARCSPGCSTPTARSRRPATCSTASTSPAAGRRRPRARRQPRLPVHGRPQAGPRAAPESSSPTPALHDRRRGVPARAQAAGAQGTPAGDDHRSHRSAVRRRRAAGRRASRSAA